MRNTLTVYQAASGFERQLEIELGKFGVQVAWRRGPLLGTASPAVDAAWAQNIWYAPEFISVTSISDAARSLRDRQRNWALCSTAHHRRAVLIQEKLPPVGKKPLRFPSPVPTAPMGAWTLWDEGTVLASGSCRSAFPNGEPRFLEDKIHPPSRAYLKLWEALLVAGKIPLSGDLCVDLGSAPGGWTWALASLGCRVFSVDKAPLAPEVARMPLVNHCEKSSGFGLLPSDAGDIDWLFCDVACYPERLYRLVTTWRKEKTAQNIVCTVKFQGETDYLLVEEFRALPGSRIVHLHHNKHELTWMSLS